MQNNHIPTDPELRAIYAAAHRARAEAVRDTFRAIGVLVSRGFAAVAGLFGTRANASIR